MTKNQISNFLLLSEASPLPPNVPGKTMTLLAGKNINEEL